MTSRRARLTLAALVLAVAGLSVFVGRPLYQWAITQRLLVETRTFSPAREEFPLYEDAVSRGFKTVARRAPHDQHGIEKVWFVGSGFLASESWFENGDRIRHTQWRVDGSVLHQTGPGPVESGFLRRRVEPPWLWNVTDQRTPSIPAWMRDEERWRAALAVRDGGR